MSCGDGRCVRVRVQERARGRVAGAVGCDRGERNEEAEVCAGQGKTGRCAETGRKRASLKVGYEPDAVVRVEMYKRVWVEFGVQ